MSRFKKVLSSLLIVVMIMTLIPPLNSVQGQGTPSMTIISLPTAPDNNGKPQSPTEPALVTTKFIDLEVEYNNIQDADLPKLYFTIYNQDTKILREIKDNPPVKVGTQRIKFQNVELTEGLNTIIVYFDSTSKPSSLPAWVQFTEVATITDLRIDNQTFSNGTFVPTRNPVPTQTQVFIDGSAPNATEVLGFSTEDSAGKLGLLFQNGDFSISAGDRNADLRLRPGDNHVVISASNPSKSYRAERTFVYNNGHSYFYNTIISGVNANVNNSVVNTMLFRQPSVVATVASGPGVDFTIDVKTDIKINRNTTDNTLVHPNLTVSLNNNIFTTIQFDDTGGVGSTIPYTVGGTSYTGTVVTHEDYYVIKDVPLNGIVLDKQSSQQVVDIAFEATSGSGFDNNNQSFVFYYVNNEDPYVSKVLFADTNTELVSGSEINVTNQSTVDFLVEHGKSPTAIRVYTNHQSAPVATSTTTDANGKFIVSLDRNQLPEGQSIVTFVPMRDTEEIRSGAREYLVRYNPTPYVYLQNFYNGQIFTNKNNIPTRFHLKPVNIPTANWNTNILVRFNDSRDKAVSAEIVNNRIEFNYQSRNWPIVNGLNNLIIELYPDGALTDINNITVSPIATFKYEIFYFEDNLPEVTDLKVPQQFLLDKRYTQLDSQSFRYFTQDTVLAFEGAFRNANQLDVIIHRVGSTTPIRSTYKLKGNNILEYDSGNGNILSLYDQTITNGMVAGKFALNSNLALSGTGTNSVEIVVTNPGGLFNSRMIEIVREPANYVVHYPKVDTSSNIAMINGNFTRMYVEAEAADKIIYDKNKEVTQTQNMYINGSYKDVFVFELKGLKRGNNKVSFTVVRGQQEVQASLTLVNADTPVIGAQYKEDISKTNIRAFNNQLQLRFPRGTVLKINNESSPNQYLSPNRDLLFGIADPIDGRVNKIMHPLTNETSTLFPTKTDWDRAYMYLIDQSGRFKNASPLYWIDAGMVNLTGGFLDGGMYPFERNNEFYTRNAFNKDNLYVPSQAGELTLAYDPNLVQAAWRYVTVFHYGYNEDYLGNKKFEWKNLGGVVDPRKNTITVPIQEFGYYRVMYMDRPHDDIINHPWARNDLETLFSKGMMVPKEQNRFETNEPITRGEFATLLVKAFDLPLNYDANGTFTDVRLVDPSSYGLYEYKYIETAARAGIVRGSLGGRFLPGNNITREDAAVMIARAANLKLEANPDRARQALGKTFTDAPNIDAYALASVLAVNRAKLIEGKPNALRPGDRRPTYYFDAKANLTRAEAAAVMMRVLLNAKKIPSL